ncbi:MAG: DNA polymerase subunit beta [Rhodocyclaceae bacterium]|nr:MAG: DNA polymerase subunit beta [Rhodocyclaceae bacterium]TND05376.1 MAG: DNA polymerase subunit beta [Rhodocyclaceae bacterium]
MDRAINAFSKKVALRHALAKLILFGSRARGDGRPDSDADVAVVLSEAHGDFMQTKLEMADMAFDVLLETGVLIQPLPIWQEEWSHPEAYSNPRLLENIQREGITL